MEKTMNFTIDGKEYTLSFTRETVIATEKKGFRIAEAVDTPIFSLTTLWRGAFLAHHPTLPVTEIDEMLNKIEKKGLLDALIDLYTEPLKSLMENDEKNVVKWTVN